MLKHFLNVGIDSGLADRIEPFNELLEVNAIADDDTLRISAERKISADVAEISLPIDLPGLRLYKLGCMSVRS